MPENKRKHKYRLEDYGITSDLDLGLDLPKPYEPNVFESQQFLGQPEIPFRPIQERLPALTDPRVYAKFNVPQQFINEKGEITTEGQTKKEDLTYGQRGLNQINNLLLGLNLHNSGIGEFTREAGSPIASGLLRFQEGMQPTKNITEIPKKLVDAPLGLASATFGALMTPFTAIKLGATSVGGETAGKISEIGSLLLAGGTPLVAGYFAAEGSTELANKILNETDLDDKDKERFLEATGLISFVLGHKVAGKTIKATNKALQTKVEKYIDEILPDNKSMKTMTIDEIQKELQEIKKEKISKLIRKDTERVLDKQDENA